MATLTIRDVDAALKERLLDSPRSGPGLSRLRLYRVQGGALAFSFLLLL